MLITVKMPTVVGILTVISMLNAQSESLKLEVFIFSTLVLRVGKISCSVEFSMERVL